MTKTKKTEPPKPWDMTQADMLSVTTDEFIRGTDRLLPPVAEIPKPFWDGNIYTRIVEAMDVGEVPPPGEVHFHPGFNSDGKSLTRMILAHLRHFDGDIDHRTAGIGYMISKVVHVTSILT